MDEKFASKYVTKSISIQKKIQSIELHDALNYFYAIASIFGYEIILLLHPSLSTYLLKTWAACVKMESNAYLVHKFPPQLCICVTFMSLICQRRHFGN